MSFARFMIVAAAAVLTVPASGDDREFREFMEQQRNAVYRPFSIPNAPLTPFEVCERDTFFARPSLAPSRRMGANSIMAVCVDEYEKERE